MSKNGFQLTTILTALVLAAVNPAAHGQKRSMATAPAAAKKPAKSAQQESVKAASPESPPVKKVYPTFGQVERLDPELDKLIPAEAKLEKLAGGFEWAEGPVWEPRSQTLLFSDVPRNVVFQWKEAVGTRDYLYPSGYTGTAPRGGEPGSNGLTLDPQGRLVLCEHGDRRVARLEGNGRKTTLAQYYLDRRFNSPNDLVYKSNGDLYFTDPPYGLEGGDKDPKKELVFSGVYLLRRDGEVALLTSELGFPNGIAISPDEKTLYVAVSDSNKPVIMAFPLRENGTTGKGRVFFDAKPLMAGRKGLPDGLKVDALGNLFATGPGGVLVITPEGKHLGTINPGEATANCAWGGDGSMLYLTADMYLCRIQTNTKGKGF
jgi:gluconolactonase